MRKLLCLGMALLVSSFATPAVNADALIQGFTGGGGPFGSFFGTVRPSGDVVGFRFTAEQTGFIAALGVLNASGKSFLDATIRDLALPCQNKQTN